MFDRIMGTAIALGLIALSLPCVPLELLAQPPDGAGVSQSRPTPEAQAEGETSDSATKHEQFSIPVRILEEPEDPEEAERRQEKERRSEEREQADLEAQRGMAQSAREMLGPARVQAWLAGIGAVLLGFSLIFSAVATLVAAKAAKAAQDVLKAERAWLTYDTIAKEFYFNPIFDDVPYDEAVGYRIVWKNSGRMPALKVKLHVDSKIVYATDAAPVFPRPTSLPSEGTIVGVSQIRETGNVRIMGEELTSFFAQDASLFIYSRVTYMDIFNPDTPRFSETCIQLVCYGRTPAGEPALGIKFVGGYDICT